MTRRNLRLPDAAAGNIAQTSTHTEQQGAGTKTRSAVAGKQDAEPRPATGTGQPVRKRKKTQALGRNRASPARLARLNAILSPNQKTLIRQWGWGGMLDVKATEMPHDLSMWVLSCFDPMRSELVIPGSGTIPVDCDSYHRVFGLPNEGRRVRFEIVPEDTTWMNEEYGIESGIAPTFQEWCDKIKGMNGVADMKFLRAYYAGVISCFICPTTKCSITPRCYGAIRNIEEARGSNFCQLAIEQICSEVKTMGCKKNSVCCCVHHLVIVYLDSVEVDEAIAPASDCPIRAAAWSNQLIQAVMQKDRKPNGEFGKLMLKEGVGATIRDGLFAGMTQTEHFVSSKLPATFPVEKKRKLSMLIGDLCKDISTRLGTFVEEYGRLNQDEPTATNVQNMRSKRQRTDTGDEDDEDDWEGDSESDEENDDSDDDEQDDEAIPGGSTSHMPQEADDRDGEEDEQNCDLQAQSRRNYRLANGNTTVIADRNMGDVEQGCHIGEQPRMPTAAQ